MAPSLAEINRLAIGDKEAGQSRVRAVLRASRGDQTNSFISLHSGLKGGVTRSGALSGCVVAVKDNIDVVGTITTSGSLNASDRPAATSAAVVEILEDCGAYVSGKLNMGELALEALSDNPHFGRVLNPWDMKRSPGGSSGGCGAAVATGLTDIALGSDSAGSVRIPASMCGVVGYRPTPGVISLDGLASPAWSIDSIGILTRTVDDLCYVASAALGVTSASGPLRAGVVLDDSLGRVHPDVAAIYAAAIRRIEDAGVTTQQVFPRGLISAPSVAAVIAYSEVAAQMQENLLAYPLRIGLPPRDLLRLGSLFSAVEYFNARRMCGVLQRRFLASIEGLDVLVTPTLPIVAPIFGEAISVPGDSEELDLFALIRFTALANVAHLPAISLPVGLTAEGLPVGLQVIGRPGRDAEVLAFAQRIEASVGVIGMPPGYVAHQT